MRKRTPEQEARQRAIATRLAAFLEQKKSVHLAKQQSTKEKRRAYDQQKSQTPERKKVLARAHKKFQRRHNSKILRYQKKRRHTIKLRRGGSRRVHTRRNPDLPRILLAGTDSILTLDELKHPRFVVYSPRHGRSIERLPYAEPLAGELPDIAAF
jgi:hypothetical protein